MAPKLFISRLLIVRKHVNKWVANEVIIKNVTGCEQERIIAAKARRINYRLNLQKSFSCSSVGSEILCECDASH